MTGPATPTVADDLATLRDYFADYDDTPPAVKAALARLEDEIARLVGACAVSGVAPDPLDALEHRARNIKTFTELPIGVFRDYGFRSKDEGLRKLALDVLALVEKDTA